MDIDLLLFLYVCIKSNVYIVQCRKIYNCVFGGFDSSQVLIGAEIQDEYKDSSQMEPFCYDDSNPNESMKIAIRMSSHLLESLQL